ncbi:MAG TPA: hypothetical protein VFD58_30195 [Blastocatellia bacterium]|nr:hypothetical protein [Blastocatellia bacterium]
MQANHLYNLLPAIYRLRDAEKDYPLRALLGVITEQSSVIEDDIAQLYENWFIETCEDWVVPYIGDLIGWRQVHEAGEPGQVGGEARNRILIPRREMANTIRARRRKGTLSLLELLASDVAGWRGRAVEFFKLLGRTQHINLPHPDRGRTVDLREGATLGLIDGPFDELAHTVDVRRINSHRTVGRYNIPSVGLFVCRLRSYSVTRTQAFGVEEAGPHCFTFSALGNDAPLFTRDEREADPTEIAGEINLPVAIRPRAFESRKVEHERLVTQASERYYGEGKSLAIWVRRGRGEAAALQMIPAARILPADLSDWDFRTPRDRVAVDPALGRIVFPPSQFPKEGVWVYYHYGFSADIGGGEYDRALAQPSKSRFYRVGAGEEHTSIRAALDHWQKDNPAHAVIEITDSSIYVEQLNVVLGENQTLQLRAANHRRPVIRLLDWQTDRPDALSVAGARGSRFTLDGLLVTGRSMMIEGEIAEVVIRHSTLVPGWGIDRDCEPNRPLEPSLELFCPHARIHIEHSIIGSIQISPLTPVIEEAEKYSHAPSAAAEAGCGGIGHGFRVDPICLHLSDSILDATDPEMEAIGTPGCPVAHARLTILRSTVFGRVQVHAVDLGENSIFNGQLFVARSQQGCLRFCYVTPGSRTPRRYHCQPDLVTKGKSGAAKAAEEVRVAPRLNSIRYGRPDYCQLARDCAEEITRGADDEAEMGVFHDLFQPQRAANLRARLDEFLPAGMDAGVIFIN